MTGNRVAAARDLVYRKYSDVVPKGRKGTLTGETMGVVDGELPDLVDAVLGVAWDGLPQALGPVFVRPIDINHLAE